MVISKTLISTSVPHATNPAQLVRLLAVTVVIPAAPQTIESNRELRAFVKMGFMMTEARLVSHATANAKLVTVPRLPIVFLARLIPTDLSRTPSVFATQGSMIQESSTASPVILNV